MNKIITKWYILIFLFLPGIPGCLKDNIIPPENVQLSDKGKLLYYLENTGDYINSAAMPSLVDADEVYSNLQNYLLIDIRSSESFSEGHIENAVNVPHSQLISYLDSINPSEYSKIIILSTNGQSSAFYACLLRLYGFDNVFSLSYGMASWNLQFASEWLAALNQENEYLLTFNLEFVPKPDLSPLPDISLKGTTLADGVKQRINEIIAEDFEDNLTGSTGSATIDFSYLFEHLQDYFIVCYNSGPLYRQLILGIAHPDGTVLYLPPPDFSDLSSTTSLQTLPSSKKIAFYSTDGQLSAFAIAYLRVLGYDARSILFGANNMFYYILSGAGSLSEEAFSQSKIRNYPYVTGN